MSLALLLGVVNAACVNLRPPPKVLPREAAGPAPMQVWTARAGRRLTGQVAISQGSLYGAGVDRKVYAVDLQSGRVLWTHRLSGIVAGGVLLTGDTVYAGSSRPEGRVYALERGGGKRIWRSTTGPVSAPLAMAGGSLIVATQPGILVALDPATGEVRWRRRLGVARVAPLPIGEDAMVVATVDSLYRLMASDGSVTHRSASPGTLLSPWITFAGGLVAGTTDSQVVSIRPTDLGLNWSVRVDAPVLGSPAAAGDTIYAASRRGTLYRIEPGPPPRAVPIVQLDWPITSAVTIVRNQILLGGADGTIRALRPDGREIWRLQVWRPVEVSPLPLEDGILAIGGDGDIHRYRR
ncbi:MAG: PQQ-binding-like beta-propeller repeat protein [Gemmatimonadales bacterium]|nr:PQQ-binding-like beta-propeller repeat protein [Gemmatimonadales bacterium]